MYRRKTDDTLAKRNRRENNDLEDTTQKSEV